MDKKNTVCEIEKNVLKYYSYAVGIHKLGAMIVYIWIQKNIALVRHIIHDAV